MLEGIGGLSNSVDDDIFSFADNLPSQWQWMEFRVPVTDKGGREHWVKARADRQQSRGIVKKGVSVEVGNLDFYFLVFSLISGKSIFLPFTQAMAGRSTTAGNLTKLPQLLNLLHFEKLPTYTLNIFQRTLVQGRKVGAEGLII